ncbi:alpha-L-fucosidase [Candidatus Zixiibacteriota bacterium]
MPRHYRMILPLLFCALSLSFTGCSSGSDRFETDKDRRMEWWREARFGLFIHWGLYSIPAGEWGEDTHHAEWIMTTAQIPVAEYEGLLGQFNPVEFDADVWVRIAKAAGMKYIVITSKHHDGFALFDSDVSDYDVMATPFKRDIMAELAEACRVHDMKMCWYHSIMDWHHPDYLPRRGWETRSAEGADFDRYVDYLRGQVTELLTNYGDIGIMWFDGEWESTWSHDYGQPLFDLCLELQPDVIVNNRVDVNRGGMEGISTDERSAGDYGTPEQQIPAMGLPGVDWETCMTMNRYWGYNRADTEYKSTRELIRMLVDIASKGGNYLLNVGPTPEGTFPQESIERLEEIGAWMDVNGDAIYGTSASPFGAVPWGRITMKSTGRKSRLYLHVFDRPDDGRIILPGIGNRPGKAWLQADRGDRIPVERVDTDLSLSLPVGMPDADCTVVVLEVKGAPIVYEAPAIEADATILVNPLAVSLTTRSSGLELRYTIDGSDPDAESILYKGPFTISSTTTIRARSFHAGEPVSAVTEQIFTQVDPEPAVALSGARDGLTIDEYHGNWDALPDFDALRRIRRGTSADVSLPDEPERVEYVGYRYSGYIGIPHDDVYLFTLVSDDGSRMLIDGEVVVDNDGLHGSQGLVGTVPLAAGAHEIVVEWFNKTGGAELALLFAPAGEQAARVPASFFKHR